MRWCGAQSADHLGEKRRKSGVVGEVVCVLGAVVSVVVAVLAAGPLCWQHEPFNAQLNPIGGMVGSLPRPPPIGLTCGLSGPRAQDAFTETEVGPDGSQASRRSPCVLGYDRYDGGGRAVGAEKSRFQQHVASYNPTTPRQASQRIRKPPHFEGSAGVMRGDGGI